MSYLTKDQLENYLSKLPGTNKGYNELKNDLTYPVEQDDLGSVKDRMNKLHLSTGTQIQSTDVRTPAFPQTPKPTRSPKVSVGSPAYVGQACAGCKQQVRGSVVSALGGLWHTRCFTCHTCHKELENEQYYEKDGLIYCAKDYRHLFSVHCNACGEPIEHQALRVLGKHYHEDHFCCCVCKNPIGGQQFKVHEDQPYCLEDYMKKFGKKCSRCGDFLQGEYVNALGQAWHKNCFHCTDCERTFQGGSFLVKDNKPYCEEHYPTANSPKKHSKSSSPQPPAPSVKPFLKPSAKPALPPKPANKKKKCHVCQSIIDGPCATALGHDYHIHHFQCHRCHRSLSSRVPGMWQGDERGELVCKMCMK